MLWRILEPAGTHTALSRIVTDNERWIQAQDLTCNTVAVRPLCPWRLCFVPNRCASYGLRTPLIGPLLP